MISALPSPFYRFQYDIAGTLTTVGYSSDLRTYDIVYEGNRMVAMQSTGSVHDRLTYVYDEAGRVSRIMYADGDGSIYARILFTYVREQLVTLERSQRSGAAFYADKRMSFVYADDGNVVQVTDQRLPFPGQTEATFVDRYERYDSGINVDGFSLLHNEFFDHLVLLPGLRLQVGNPGAVTRTGSGINYRIDYSYTYDTENRPVAKHGEGVIVNGSNPGQRFQTHSTFLYD